MDGGNYPNRDGEPVLPQPGRAGGGISGGDDTPKKTYWAYEFESGKYVLGSFHDDVLNIECETDSSDIWTVDEDGIYIENIALHSYLESEIVDAINAKYGTNFSELTVIQVTDIAIGDDCPNWEEYGKIELESTYITNFAPGFLGRIIDAIAYIYVKNGTCLTASNEGKILGTGAPFDQSFKSYIQNVLTGKGYNVSNIEALIKDWNVGYNILNWDEYVEV